MKQIIALGLLVAAFLPAASRAADAPRHLNILFILSDDQRYDTIHALGNNEIKTPTLDKLVGRGFHFNNAYCQGGMVGAVCLPSRTMLLTGRSLFHIPQAANIPGGGKGKGGNARGQAMRQKFDGPTLAGVFNDAGFATLHCGKRGNSFVPAMEAFQKVIYSHGATGERRGKAEDEIQTNQPKICADAAIEFLHGLKKDQHFLIYLAPHYPHDPRIAPKEYMDMYDPAKISLPPNFMPDHPFDNGDLHVRDEELAPHPRTPEVMKRHLADYYACISWMDFQIGRVLDVLKETGHEDDTVVVFSSDQGLSVGGWHGLMGKQNLYEEFKSPLIFAGPGVPHGQSDALVYLYDLFPTVCDFAGVPIPKVAEGSSLVPIIDGKEQKVRDALFAAYKDVQRMARDDRWKLLWYPKINRFQLFDLKNDPNELHDLADDPAHAGKLAEMKKLLKEQQDKFEDDKAPRPQ